jgi:hypothetical protein
MDRLSLREEAHIHRGAYIATLRAALAEWERHADLATSIGRSRVFLSYLLREDGTQTPSPETAERIVRALPLPSEQRHDLFEHMVLSAERRLRARRKTRQLVSEASLEEMVERMRAAHWAAMYAVEASVALPQYQLLRDLANDVLRVNGLRQSPLVFVETCLLLHDAETVLDRPGDALFHARLAGTVMRSLDPADYQRGRERFEHLRVNVSYAEAVTLASLGLANQAERPLLNALVASQQSVTARTFWLPYLYRHQLVTVSGKPRFSQYQVRELAYLAKVACVRRADPLDPQVDLLIEESLASAYLRFGSERSARAAARLLQPAVESLTRVPYLGPLHRTILFKSYARACWALHRTDEWRHYVHQALTTAIDAGLQHQVRVIRRQYDGPPQSPSTTTGSLLPSQLEKG